MNEFQKKFKNQAEKKAFDLHHRKIIQFNIGRYDLAVPKGKTQYSNLELAKQRVAFYKHKAINDLDQYLIEFEANFKKNGGKLIWARDAEDAIKEITAIAKKHKARQAVKSKSMITEELELNEYLEKQHIASVETDLGEFIVQIAGEKPYHIITPVMHKSKEIIAELFHEKYKLPKESTPEQITAFVRQLLREKFQTADIGITGVNFLIADIGGIALTENEGNGLMTMAFPKIHIAIVGIEKMIPSVMNLDLMWPILSTHGTGQNITVYNTIITGPKQENETDGPEEMYVVILDNNRSELLKQVRQRSAMHCIRCGACLNGCPIYKNIGGHTYDTTYSGPIGSVITPHLRGMEKYKHLSFASSLCGKCTEVCPAKIELHRLLLYNRNDSVLNKLSPASEKFTMWGWKKVMTSKWMIDFFGGKTKNIFLKLVFKKPWGKRRSLPVLQPKSFRKQWKDKYERK